MENKNILVTGGSGFLGSALVGRLIDKNAHVRVFDNNSRGRMRRLQQYEGSFDFVEGDIRDSAAVMRAAKGMDTICHLAFINGTRFFYEQPQLVLDVGVRGMINVLDACIKNAVPELVLASSSEVYQTPPRIPTDENVPLSIPDPFNPRYSYAGGKIISELMSIHNGGNIERVLIFRPHNVYGPDMGWEHVIPEFTLRMHELVQKYPSGPIPFPIQGTGEETRSFIFIDDFIDGLILMIEKGKTNSIYHIGSKEEISVKHLAECVGDYFGRDVELTVGKTMAGGTMRRCPDISRLQALGFKPKYTIKDGLPITAKWYVENENLRVK